MIVSALVVTSWDSIQRLSEDLGADHRLEVGVPEGGFLPIVATTDSLNSSRLLCEELLKRGGVKDVQLVSFVDESLIFDVQADDAGSKEPQ